LQVDAEACKATHQQSNASAKQRISKATHRMQAIHFGTSSSDGNTHTPSVQVVAHIGVGGDVFDGWRLA